MRCFAVLTIVLPAACFFAAAAARGEESETWKLSAELAQKIEAAAPEKAPATPARPRKVLVYGRVPTHPESVACCFRAMEILGRKTGAFEAIATGDPEVFAPDSLKQFDTVVMNNTHEQRPLMPRDFQQLSAERQKAAAQREEAFKKSLLSFVAGGKGIVGIHGAVAGGVRWPEYLELLGGSYSSHITDSVWVKLDEPDHPLCAPLSGKPFEINDEIYFFGPPHQPEKLRILMSLDLAKTPDPKKRDDKNYAVSWVRRYGKGRVFYCSLGHVSSVYCDPLVLRHYLAGIQFAVGDLKAEAQPREKSDQ